MRLKIKGRPENISLEEARSWIWASLVVLQYHKLEPKHQVVTVRFKKNLRNNDMGQAHYDLSWIDMRTNLSEQESLTTILHETIHICVRFKEGSVEACTTTLCSKIKRDVAMIAAVLLHNTYRRAAALAHCKMSYRPGPGQEDFYNKEEDRVIPWEGKFRNKRNKESSQCP